MAITSKVPKRPRIASEIDSTSSSTTYPRRPSASTGNVYSNAGAGAATGDLDSEGTGDTDANDLALTKSTLGPDDFEHGLRQWIVKYLGRIAIGAISALVLLGWYAHALFGKIERAEAGVKDLSESTNKLEREIVRLQTQVEQLRDSNQNRTQTPEKKTMTGTN
jgi:hypothetical protein